jgi:hypothetical protein
MSRSINKALDKLERSAHLTPDGRNWLIAACDPFHDVDLSISGYPDVCSASTIVQLVKKQFTVSASEAVVTAGLNWDCNIVAWPTIANIVGGIPGLFANYNTINQNGAVIGGAALDAVYPYSGVIASGNVTGSSTWPTINDFNPIDTYTFENAVVCPEYIAGQCRIVGMAFEVVNTTAQLYKQGQVTCWRQPTTYTQQQFNTNIATTPAFTQYRDYQVMRMPPGTLADAQLLYGSRSWEAAEGAYVVSRQSGMDNPFNQPTLLPFAATTTDFDANGPFTGSDHYVIYTTGNGITGLAEPTLLAPYDTSGAYFTGLSPQTTLQVNVRWLIERMPAQAETDLVVLATPSAPYDPLALELYSQCMRDMPPGVMLSENPLGEWFANALGKVAEWAPQIGGFLGNFIPGAGLVGNAVGAASKLGADVANQFVDRPLPASGSQMNPQQPRSSTVESRRASVRKPVRAKRRTSILANRRRTAGVSK